eukprot:TRINITY_DN30212_c0_g1_i1.p1 TRINITY_DN30212_c0_g1~~TRINITY_DN30212_c0_g1_i1.p1  ORF type:complete len:347 (+),score=131.85 TRINITY_DN30212_c0_g1_i1:63-1103(+)
MAEKHDGEKEKATVPWVEKYRPRKIDDVVHQTEVTTVMRKVLEDERPNLPHLLFYGPPGSGKTSAILAMSAQLFGPKYKSTRVLELNASDDRGIKVIRQKVKTFAQGAINNNPDHTQSGVKYPVPPYKIIILDEADALLPDAQAALRRIIEEYCTVTRFCLICNYVSRIIEPLVSRCAKFRFKPITKETLYGRIEFIAAKEGLKLSPASLASLDSVSQGDLRLAVQYLQASQKAFGADLSAVNFNELAGWVPAPLVNNLFDSFGSKNFASVLKAVQDINDGGYSALQLLQQLADVVEGAERLSDGMKANILMRCAAAEKPLQDGASEKLQLQALGGYCLSVVSGMA